MLENYCSATEFYLLGFPGSEGLHHTLFTIFCFFYIVTLMGNTVIIVIVCVDKRLRSPMYFFLGHLSSTEILITTVVVPVLLWGLLIPGRQTISLTGGVVQLFLQLALGTTEFGVIGAVAVDCYMAICNPLMYNIIMNSHTCNSVVIVSWTFGFLYQIWPVYATFQLTYCKSNVINNFYCDQGQVLKLSCDNTGFLQFIFFIMAIFVLFGSLIPTVVSYAYIISTILKMTSACGWRKAFSTCASHFTCVVLGFGSCLFLYVKPKQTQAAEYNRVVFLMISIVTPCLNPFIFTFWNEEVIEVLWDGEKRCCQLFRN